MAYNPKTAESIFIYLTKRSTLKRRGKSYREILCPICNRVGKAVRDHDHTTNTWRDIICSKCNVVLGFIEDNPTIAIQLAGYLKHWNKQTKEVK